MVTSWTLTGLTLLTAITTMLRFFEMSLTEMMKKWYYGFRNGRYRDALELLNRLGIHWRMPALLSRGQSQLSTEEGNESRQITKLRWIVEARNGHLKSIFKFLGQTIQITHVPNLGDFYRIGGAIINKYHPLITMEKGTAKAARIILAKSQEENLLMARVKRDNLHTRNAQRWVKLDAQHVPDFPVLSMEALKDLTVGIYQVKLASSYIQDKLQREEAEEFQVEMMRDVDNVPEVGLIRVRTFSRFRNATKYQLWISYRAIDGDDNNDDNLIEVYYCICFAGARTLGSCAHIASVIWFLGYARHTHNVRYPSIVLQTCILDAGNRPLQDNRNIQ